MDLRSHPLRSWSVSHGALALTLPILLLVIPSLVLAITKPLNEDETAGGILDLEFAGSVDRATEIVESWRAAGVLDTAAFIHGVDFLFPFLYAGALAAGSLAAGAAWQRAGRPGLASVAVAMAWIATAAIVFDYAENFALLPVILGDPDAPWPQLTLAFAIPKTTCIVASFIYALSGFFAGWGARATRRRTPA